MVIQLMQFIGKLLFRNNCLQITAILTGLNSNMQNGHARYIYKTKYIYTIMEATQLVN